MLLCLTLFLKFEKRSEVNRQWPCTAKFASYVFTNSKLFRSASLLSTSRAFCKCIVSPAAGNQGKNIHTLFYFRYIYIYNIMGQGEWQNVHITR